MSIDQCVKCNCLLFVAFCFLDCVDVGPISNFVCNFFFFGFNYKEIKWDQDTVECEYVIVNILFVRVVVGSIFFCHL